MTDDKDHRPAPGASRRAVLLGAGALGVGALGATSFLAGCSATPGAPLADGGARNMTDPKPKPETAGRPVDAIKVSDIPVGGAKIFPDQNVVVSQPAAGTFKAFSARCTHMGCQVADVSGDTITCPCHGSQYSIATGSVKRGPAVRGLSPKNVTVSGDTLTVS